jgi:hypothetical protein
MLLNQAWNLSSHKNAYLLRIILNSFVRIANTERNNTRKIRQTVTRNTEFIGAVVTFKLRLAQQLK